ncbi:MAG: hypothetical protein ACODAE_01245 [Gemmatimonadota bacterium]
MTRGTGTLERAKGRQRRGRGAGSEAADERSAHALRDDALIVGGLVLLHLVLAALAFDPTPHTGGDNAGYIALARGLLEQGAYLDLWRPDEAVHTKYPPFFPAALSVGMLLGLEAWAGLKLVVVAFSVVAVAATYLWLRRRHGIGFAAGVTIVVAASPGVLHLSHWILSDVPFWALTVLALWAFERLEPERRGPFALALAATALAYLTRSAGLPLVVAAAGWLALERRWRPLLALGAVLAPVVVGWMLWGRVHGGTSYFDEFLAVNPYAPALGGIGPLDVFGRIADNAGRYLGTHLPRMLMGYDGEPVLAVGVLVAGLGVAGWALRLRAGRTAVAELFFPLYLGLLLLWPAVWAGDRFLLPLLPLIVAYAAEAVLAAVRRASPGAVRGAAIGVLAVALLAMAPGVSALARQGSACTRLYLTGERYPCMAPAWVEFFAMAEWSGDALPEGAAVLSRKPRLFWAASGGLPGDIYPSSEEPAEFFAYAREIGARHLAISAIDNLWGLYVAPAIRSRPDRFCVVRSLGADRATVFGIHPDDGAAGADGRSTAEAGEAALGPCPAEFLGRGVR